MTMPEEILYRETDSYRITLDRSGAGSIRILKRVNFRTIVSVLEEIFLASRKHNPGAVRVIVYIPRSIHDQMSDNVRELFGFCNHCTDLAIDVTLVE